ncbi:hypothetical protein [Allorhodopirellula solitaria]|uniref:Uncharacterized protein n=1 Tax=Allorhodopirellula solitaria TaxID=2527987 RepID=A0A5C5X1J0_9BACT|nr:hypothetical protein [Allorhodopirellula solitaria]TWT56161.1 hypothetical protein CA85_45030 [Allorhodopirellula solitaria]
MTWIARLRRALLGAPIRIAPDEGRLLGLQVGQRVLLDDALLVVIERDQTPREDKPGIRYRLATYDETSNRLCLPDPPYLIEPGSFESDHGGIRMRRVPSPTAPDPAQPSRDEPVQPGSDDVWIDCRLLSEASGK